MSRPAFDPARLAMIALLPVNRSHLDHAIASTGTSAIEK